LIWVVRNRLSRPTQPLTVDDLPARAAPLTLASEEQADP
jgi:exodeoxyribonuclease-5